MKKEKYEGLEISVEEFETDDVITVSDPDGEGWTEFVPLGISSGRTFGGR